jgi:hypothetical protein
MTHATSSSSDESGDGVVVGVPSDNTSLLDVLDEFAKAGYAGSLTADDGSIVRCDTCGQESPAARFDVVASRRMEGASDPADMVHVVAAACPHCSAIGVIVLGYGPDASEVDVDVAAALVVPHAADPADGGH